MTDHKNEKNRIILSGEIVEEGLLSHHIAGEPIYQTRFRVSRLSKQIDLLPITFSSRLLPLMTPSYAQDKTCILGQIRSYNKMTEGRSHLVLTVFAKEVLPTLPDGASNNEVYLDGFICRSPIYRTTPFMREITDMLVAINRPFNKSDYIPAIAWGNNARLAQEFKTGDRVIISGRMQSREYQKKYSEDTSVLKLAYEVSVSTIRKAGKDEPPYLDTE